MYLSKIDFKEKFSPILVLVFFCCAVFIAGTGAAIGNIYAKSVIVTIRSKDLEEDISKIGELAVKKYKKEVLNIESGKRIYKAKNRYVAWLTNPITIESEENIIHVSLPSGCLEGIKKEIPFAIVSE